jgi:tetratricopeptide (TPR) repeat protein
MKAPERRFRLIIVSVLLFIGILVAGLLWMRAFSRKITAQGLLREALSESPDHNYPETDIFEQQATQGYYDDALATARLAKKPADLDWFVVELAKIHVENGDVQGGKAVAQMFPDRHTQIFKAIALLQAHQGDLSGALATASSLPDMNEILLEFASYQVAQADFKGALATSERLNRPADLFYEIGDALRQRDEQKRVRELAAGMSNRKLAASFLEVVPFTMWDHPEEVRTLYLSACEMAYEDATHNQFPKAVQTLQQNHCRYSYTAIRYYEIDPAAAEKLMRSSTNPDDLRFGLQELAMAAAKKGRIEDALEFRADAKKVDPKESYNSTLEIALAWTKRDGPRKVLPWARSQPTPGDRRLALLGMAEALGHERPHQPQYQRIH